MDPIINKKKTKFKHVGLLFPALCAAAFMVYFFTITQRKIVALKNDSTFVNPPVFTKPSGFYKEPFLLEIKRTEKGTVFFTTDGSNPGPESQVYQHPIKISSESERNKLIDIPTSPRWKKSIGDFPRAVVVRAVIATPDGRKSDVTSASFIMEEFVLPVVSLYTDYKYLFGYKSGIYIMGKGYEDKDRYAKKRVKLDIPWWLYPANYQSRGINAIRPCTIEIFNGKRTKSKEVFVSIHGNATRGFSQKSLRLNFNKVYSDSLLVLNDSIKNYKTLILRNAGNDWDKAFMRDAIAHRVLVKAGNLDVSEYQPIILFINGTYWGLHLLCERLDEDYLSLKYNKNKSNFSVIEQNGKVFFGTSGDAADFKRMINYASTAKADTPEVLDSISRMIDLRNFTDYFIAQLFFVNTDWPHNNLRCWRFKKDELTSNIGNLDGKWRWLIYDMDYSLGYTTPLAYKTDMFEKINDQLLGSLFKSLMSNRTFREFFYMRSHELMNTILSSESILKEVNNLQEELKNQMPTHIRRWRVPSSLSTWEENVEVIKTFARERKTFYLQHLELQMKKYN